jgi:hypothetical protein
MLCESIGRFFLLFRSVITTFAWPRGGRGAVHPPCSGFLEVFLLVVFIVAPFVSTRDSVYFAGLALSSLVVLWQTLRRRSAAPRA